jgi:hypothetical protein
MKFNSSVFALPVAFGVMLAPSWAMAEEKPEERGGGMAVKPPSADVVGYQKFRPHRPLMSTGAGLFVGTYATSAIVAAVNDNDADRNLYIPVVGPWLDLADRQCDNRTCDNEGWSKAALIASGVLQGAGVAVAVASAFLPEKINEEKVATTTPSLRVAPGLVGARGYGLALLATF